MVLGSSVTLPKALLVVRLALCVLWLEVGTQLYSYYDVLGPCAALRQLHGQLFRFKNIRDRQCSTIQTTVQHTEHRAIVISPSALGEGAFCGQNGKILY